MPATGVGVVGVEEEGEDGSDGVVGEDAAVEETETLGDPDGVVTGLSDGTVGNGARDDTGSRLADAERGESEEEEEGTILPPTHTASTRTIVHTWSDEHASFTCNLTSPPQEPSLQTGVYFFIIT